MALGKPDDRARDVATLSISSFDIAAAGRSFFDIRTTAMVSAKGETDRDKVRRNEGRIQDEIIIALAGPFAQRRYRPRSHWRVGASGAPRGEFLVGGSDIDHVTS